MSDCIPSSCRQLGTPAPSESSTSLALPFSGVIVAAALSSFASQSSASASDTSSPLSIKFCVPAPSASLSHDSPQ